MAIRTGNAPFHFQSLTAAGSTQADATAINFEVSPGFIVAFGNSIVGLRLPFPGKGKMYYINNQSISQMGNLFVYPSLGVQINSLGANAALVMLPQTATLLVAGGGQWYTCPVVPS